MGDSNVTNATFCVPNLRFLKKDVVQDMIPTEGRSKDLDALDYSGRKNQLGDDEISVGVAVREYLHEAKISTFDRSEFFHKVRDFYSTALRKLLGFLPLNNRTLQDLCFLQPSLRLSPELARSAIRVAKKLITVISEDEYEKLANEWSLYAEDNTILKSWYTTVSATGKEVKIPIDHFWSKIVEMRVNSQSAEQKYALLVRVALAAMCLPHGNAETERSFSLVNHIMRKDRANLDCHTLNSLLSVKSYIQTNDLSCYSAIPKDWIHSAKVASQKYESRLEKQKRKMKKEERSRKLKTKLGLCKPTLLRREMQKNEIANIRVTADLENLENRELSGDF